MSRRLRAEHPASTATIDELDEALAIAVDPGGYPRIRWDDTEAVAPVRSGRQGRRRSESGATIGGPGVLR